MPLIEEGILTKEYTSGICSVCHKQSRENYFLNKRKCWICRKPVEIRPLLLAEVPFSSATCLLQLFRKCPSAKTARTVLALVHPVLMENIKVSVSGSFELIDKKWVWVRRNGWRELR